ncbi:MAG: hypothetical protein KKF95_05095 [Nanoarchaeota archaeon]|nr:hypothetical protein [Nanoarchaeota archaeon]MBU2443422.1 hypothetical protein [Nanoarchaeota archaeon]
MNKTTSIVGETAAVIAVINFITWAASITPSWTLWIWIIFGIIFIIDWMLGGVADKWLYDI